MKLISNNYQVFLVAFVTMLALNCSNDDDSIEEEEITWASQVDQLKLATDKYIDFSVAEQDGLFDVSGYVPNMGHHYLNPTLSDGQFELEKPEIILYVPDQNGEMQMVGVEYSIVPDDANNPGTPPEGFVGDQDEWHFNEMIGQWQLHVWTVLDNPSGIFHPTNPVIGD